MSREELLSFERPFETDFEPSGSQPLGSDLASALRAMQTLSTATGGAFDPAVGTLVDLWRGPAVPTPARQPPPSMAQALALDGQRATLMSGTKLDAGGIGKGIALDAAAALLRARGVQAAYLDFGGSSQLAIGAGAWLYTLLFGPLNGRPTAISKINTLVQLLYVLGAIAQQAFGWPPPPTVLVLGALVLITTSISGIDYVATYTRRARTVARTRRTS